MWLYCCDIHHITRTALSNRHEVGNSLPSLVQYDDGLRGLKSAPVQQLSLEGDAPAVQVQVRLRQGALT